MIKRRNKFKKQAIPITFGVLIVGSVIASIGDIQQKGASFAQLKENANQSMFSQLELQRRNEEIKEQQLISRDRIANFGCRAMVNQSGSALASLRNEAVITNRGVKSPLAPGNCVVGANGETAIIDENGRISAIAAGKPEYAVQALKQVRGAGKVYYFHAKEGN